MSAHLSPEAAADGVRQMARTLVAGGWHPANVVAHAACLQAFAGDPGLDEYRQITRALGYPEFCRLLTAAAWACRSEQGTPTEEDGMCAAWRAAAWPLLGLPRRPSDG